MSKRHYHQWGGPFRDDWGMHNRCLCGVKRYWPWTRWQLLVERLKMMRYHFKRKKKYKEYNEEMS